MNDQKSTTNKKMLESMLISQLTNTLLKNS
jgi:hypothetical protein